MRGVAAWVVAGAMLACSGGEIRELTSPPDRGGVLSDGGSRSAPGVGLSRADATGAIDDTAPVGFAGHVDHTESEPMDARSQGDAAGAASHGHRDDGVEPSHAAPIDDPRFAPWATNWRLDVDHPALRPERHGRHSGQRDDRAAALFDSTAAGPGAVLLHAMPGAVDAAGPAVLLVHGAGADAWSTWAEPFGGALLGGQGGLAARLAGGDHAVFALTFPHAFGDVRNQAIQLAAAVDAVVALRGGGDLAVVAHSKGGMAVAALTGGLLAGAGVARPAALRAAVLLGVPLGGMDWTFRHPNAGLVAFAWGLPMPSPWDRALVAGLWQVVGDDGIHAPPWIGLQQLCARWDARHPLSVFEQDWYTTYEGGQGFVSHAPGIDQAIAAGGDFIATLRDHPMDDGVAVTLVAGASPWVAGVMTETTGPSDGLVFVASATDERVAPGASVRVVDALNHWDLVADRRAHDIVVEALAP